MRRRAASRSIFCLRVCIQDGIYKTRTKAEVSYDKNGKMRIFSANYDNMDDVLVVVFLSLSLSSCHWNV